VKSPQNHDLTSFYEGESFLEVTSRDINVSGILFTIFQGSETCDLVENDEVNYIHNYVDYG